MVNNIVISYGSLLTLSDKFNYISKGMCVYFLIFGPLFLLLSEQPF